MSNFDVGDKVQIQSNFFPKGMINSTAESYIGEIGEVTELLSGSRGGLIGYRIAVAGSDNQRLSLLLNKNCVSEVKQVSLSYEEKKYLEDLTEKTNDTDIKESLKTFIKQSS